MVLSVVEKTRNETGLIVGVVTGPHSEADLDGVSIRVGHARLMVFDSCAQAVESIDSAGAASAYVIDHEADRLQARRLLSVCGNLEIPVIFMPFEPSDKNVLWERDFAKAVKMILAAAEPRVETRFSALSRRETEVVRWLVQGLPNKQIAAKLFISVRTVEKHRASVYEKLQTRNVTDLTRIWLEEQSLTDPAELPVAA